VDSTSADVGSGQGPSLELISSDQTTVVQGSVTAGAGASRSLRFENLGAGDVYQIRAYDTTYSIARLNNSGTQTTFLILAKASGEAPVRCARQGESRRPSARLSGL